MRVGVSRIGTTSLATSAAVLTQRRHFEYWGLTVGPRTQPYARGEKVSQMHNDVGVQGPSDDGLRMTGNNTIPAYDIDMFHDRDKKANYERNYEVFFSGLNKYVLRPLNPDFSETVSKAISGLTPSQKENMWRELFKDYPNFAKPMQQDVQEEFIEFYEKISAVAHDEKAATEVAEPFVLMNYEQRFITWTYWWRIAEKLMNELESLPGVRAYEARSIRLVIERATKIIYNVFADQPWAHDELTSPHFHDICGHRAIHEAGFW